MSDHIGIFLLTNDALCNILYYRTSDTQFFKSLSIKNILKLCVCILTLTKLIIFILFQQKLTFSLLQKVGPIAAHFNINFVFKLFSENPHFICQTCQIYSNIYKYKKHLSFTATKNSIQPFFPASNLFDCAPTNTHFNTSTNARSSKKSRNSTQKNNPPVPE